MLATSAALAVGLVASFLVWRRRSVRARAHAIDRFIFPSSIAAKVREAYPHLSAAQAATVMDGLRQYFHVSFMADGRMVSMPSKAVDTAWHEFILFTRLYQDFCQKALGRFLHHTPAEAMHTQVLAQDGIKRAWRLACKREGINPAAPKKLPLLFAMDTMLAIPGGYKYALDCRIGSDYCASHIGCGGGCSSSSGSNCAGDGGGDGGGGGCGGD